MTKRQNDLNKANTEYNRGTKKIKLGKLIREKNIELKKCNYCEIHVYTEYKFKSYTISGSIHKCKLLTELKENSKDCLARS